LWRISPARLRTVNEITYLTKRSSWRKIRTPFRVRDLGDAMRSGGQGGAAHIFVDGPLGTTVLHLDFSPAAATLATLVDTDEQFDLFVSYKTQDVEDTPCLEMVEAARD